MIQVWGEINVLNVIHILVLTSQYYDLTKFEMINKLWSDVTTISALNTDSQWGKDVWAGMFRIPLMTC